MSVVADRSTSPALPLAGSKARSATSPIRATVLWIATPTSSRSSSASVGPRRAPRMNARPGIGVGIATTLALYIALRRVDESFMVIALALGLVEAVAFMLARPTFEMLYLSEGYAAATTDAQRAMFLAAGEAMLATFTGTAFHLSINLFSIYFLIVSGVMLRSNIFGRVPAYMGILAAIFNWALYIPRIGLFLSILSVFPFLTRWNILVARRLFQLGKAS